MEEKPTKEQLIEDPMKYIDDKIELHIDIPTFKNLDKLNAYLMRKYQFEIGGSLKDECDKDQDDDECDDNNPYDENAEGHEQLFYNQDLRSFVGFLWGDSNLPDVIDAGFIDFVFIPRYFVGSGSGKDYHYDEGERSWKNTYWKKIIEDAEIIEIN